MRPAELASLVYALMCLCFLSVVYAEDQADQSEESEPAARKNEKTYIIKLEAPRRKPSCQAKISYEYFQKGDDVNVAGQVSKNGCSAASGEYTVSVRFRTEDGETRNVDFVESWARDDSTPIEFDKNYTMGPDTDLVRVRTKRLICVCTEPETEIKAEE